MTDKVPMTPGGAQKLRDELARLDQAIKTAYSIDADLALASLPDLQGLGGSAGSRARS